MQTLESLLKKGTTILKDNGLEEAGLDAWLLLEFKTGKNRAYYFAHGDEPVSDETAAEYLTLIGRRAGHIPVQQLTHQAFFMGYEFYVNENVLIPRQDTETLVEEALKHLGDVEKTGDPGYVYRLRLHSAQPSSGTAGCLWDRCGCFTGSTGSGKKECRYSKGGEPGGFCGKRSVLGTVFL